VRPDGQDVIRVLHVLPGLGYGGLEAVAINLMGSLPRDRFEVYACTLSHAPVPLLSDISQRGIEVHEVGGEKRGGFSPGMILRLSDLLRRRRIDVCHTHNIAAEIYGHMGVLLARTPILIHHEHGTLHSGHPARLVLKRMFAPGKDHWIAVSDYVRQFLLERAGVPGNKVTVIHNGLPPADGEQAPPTNATVCTVTRLSPEKGVETLIDAWALVNRAAPEATLTIVGSGHLAGELNQRAADIGVSGRVRFLGFQRPPLASVHDCSIFVLPSHSEGFGMALLEAMRAGKAVIASRVGGIPEFVEHGRSGILVPPGDPAALSEAILSLLRNPARAMELARAGQRVAERFTLERSVRGVTELYEGTIRRKLGLTFSAGTGRWERRPPMTGTDNGRPGARQEPRIALCAAGEIWGGVEQFILTVAEELRRRGVPFVVLLHQDAMLARRLRDASLPVEVIHSAGKYDPLAIFRLTRAFRRHRINVVHVNGYKAAILAGIAAKLAGLRLVKTEHGMLEPFQGPAKVKMATNAWLDEFLSRRILDAVAFVSRDIQTALAKRYSGVRQAVVYNAIHPTLAPALTATALLPQPAVPEFRMGIVGRLKPIKGHEVLLRAMARLRKRPDLALYVFGEGETEASCRALCKEAAIEDQVHFMGFRSDVAAYMRQMDAIVMPSFHEGIPYTALEAMDLGVPLIASDVGGLREILTHDVDAVLVPPGDPVSLASAIERMAGDEGLRERLRLNARRTVAERFGAAPMVDHYLDLYRIAAQRP
jgi:glycosyltransferase involved in cell wall biosynthesis